MLVKLIRSLVAVACALLLAPATQAESVDNETVTIIDFYESYPGYDVDYAIDTGPDAELSDYASLGGSVDTYIEFDLGETYSLSEIIYTDRVTSGGGNFTWVGGLHDFVFFFNFILSVDDNFTNGDGQTDDILIEVETEEPLEAVPDISEIAQLQTTVPVPDLPVRYVRWEIVDTRGQNPGANNFEFVIAGGGGAVNGDFNNNGDLDAGDLDLLAQAQQQATPDLALDLNGDSLVNFSDRALWVTSVDYKHTWIGDADLNGEFNSSDLVSVLASGTYETNQPSTWSTGDFDGDGRTNSSDLVAALADGGYEAGVRTAVAAVPEPGTLLLGLLAVWPALAVRRRVLTTAQRPILK